MTVLTGRHRLARKGVLALVAAMLLLAAMTLMAQPSTAAGAEAAPSPASDVGVAAWTPTVSPLFTASSQPAEYVFRNQTDAQRSYYLNNCPLRYLCISVGQGDGLHTVFQLYYCDGRTLGNFIDAGGATNHQTGGVRAFFVSNDGNTKGWIPADNHPYKFNPYPYDILWPCDHV
ncbi:hypothetical protein [Streptomyces pseudovenezuelae]|uniref:ABC-type transport system substrate-binding protein n=1 Tax=Streptomyces pseudovenezuelae TaxID=67350 RepID=A0ABT6LZF1_9ACTN|nr:hypothetical protein [Streptomyces pseudovenezuelae]MDH6221687.1 ABC-type transport system substrate-binding protein [Streptomyces pseudovenezuelae]